MGTTSDAAHRLREIGDDLWNEAILWPRNSVQRDAFKDASTAIHDIAGQIEDIEE